MIVGSVGGDRIWGSELKDVTLCTVEVSWLTYKEVTRKRVGKGRGRGRKIERQGRREKERGKRERETDGERKAEREGERKEGR